MKDLDKRQVMIDIETFGLGPDAAIASIGACTFYVAESLKVVDKFYFNIDQASNKKINRVYTKSTLDWWSDQSEEVKNSLMSDQVNIKDAIDSLFNFVNRDDILWAHGISFDIPIIESTYRALGYDRASWHYRNLRCSRTLTSIFGISSHADSNMKHNALADAISQAEQLNALLFEIKGL